MRQMMETNQKFCGGRIALQQASRKRPHTTMLLMMNTRFVIFRKTRAMFKITIVRLRTPF